MRNLLLYHGSFMPVRNPKANYNDGTNDFGNGFYLTSDAKQAEKWALRKALRKQKSAIVNAYELSADLGTYKVLQFKQENEKWLDFVCACRKGDNIYKNYDIIIGAVANDDVFKTVDMYFRGIWSKKKALEELRYYKMNDQICIINQNVLDEKLVFQKAYQVSQNAK